MATPADPNKAKLTDSQTIEAAQPGYGLLKSQWGKVYHGQVLEVTGGTVTLSVANGVVTAEYEATP